MSMAETFRQLARTARVIGGDLFRACDYAALPSPEEIDGQIVYVAPVIRTAVPILFAGLVITDTRTDVEPQTEQVIIAAADLAGITPQVGHVIRQTGSQSCYRVTAVETDPAQAAWVLQVERSAGGWPIGGTP